MNLSLIRENSRKLINLIGSMGVIRNANYGQLGKGHAA